MQHLINSICVLSSSSTWWYSNLYRDIFIWIVLFNGLLSTCFLDFRWALILVVFSVPHSSHVLNLGRFALSGCTKSMCLVNLYMHEHCLQRTPTSVRLFHFDWSHDREFDPGDDVGVPKRGLVLCDAIDRNGTEANRFPTSRIEWLFAEPPQSAKLDFKPWPE